MMILPTTLSLITTHHCTAACDHCCFGCTPQVPKSKRIPFQRMMSLIDEAKEIPTMQVVGFTGGECFTLGQELDDLVEHATQQGLITRCVTNGYWATTLETARRRVERLRKAGLKEINFSTGTYHGKFVPYKRIRHGLIATLDAGLSVVLNIETFDGSDNLPELWNDPEVQTRLNNKKLLIQRIVWMPNEGQSALEHREGMYRFNQEKNKGCKTVYNVLAVNPDQNLIACCGLHLEKIPELKLGSVAQHSIKDILKSAPDDILKIWIHLDGPEHILMRIKERLPGVELPLKAVHPCETCLFLYKTPELRQAIKALCQENAKEIMKRFQEKLMFDAYRMTAVSHLLDRHEKVMLPIAS